MTPGSPVAPTSPSTPGTRLVTPAVSVVIPCRDVLAVVPRQLRALGQQSFSGQLEVVLADNGSVDGLSHANLQDVLGPAATLRVVPAGDVAGVSHARNVGCAAASHAILLICDADDLVAPGWVSAMVAALDVHDLVGGGLETSRLNHPTTRSWRVQLPPGTLPEKLGFLPYAQGCNVGLRRAVLDATGGWDESLVGGGDDVDFSWRAQLAGFSLGAAPDAVVHYAYRTGLRALAQQSRAYGQSDRPLAVAYGPYGAAVPGGDLAELRRLVLKAPAVLWNRSWRGQWVNRAASLCGRRVG